MNSLVHSPSAHPHRATAPSVLVDEDVVRLIASTLLDVCCERHLDIPVEDHEAIAERVAGVLADRKASPAQTGQLVSAAFLQACRADKELVDALGNLLAFVGQLTPEEYVKAMRLMNVPGMAGANDAHLADRLGRAMAQAWTALARATGDSGATTEGESPSVGTKPEGRSDPNQPGETSHG